MRTPRWLATCMLLLGALALAVPAVTLAAGGGGSAGDQQYTDPFGGTSTPTTSKPKTTATTPPQTTATTPPQTTSTAPAAPTTSPTPVASTQTASDPTTPTATIASSTPGTLPRTGYDSWVAAAGGFMLVGGGLALRIRARRS